MSEFFVSCPFGEIHLQLATKSASTLKKASAHIRVRASVSGSVCCAVLCSVCVYVCVCV